MHTAHWEYVSQLGILWQFATHDLLPVYRQLCALYTNQLDNTLQGWEYVWLTVKTPS